MKFTKQRILFVRIHLVDRKKERLAGTRQQTGQFAIGARDLGAGVDHHNDGRRFFERNLGLTKDFRRYEVFVVRNDAARIDYSKLMPEPFDLSIKAIARDAGLVSDDGAPRSGQMVEQRRFPNVGPSDDGDEWGLLFLAQRSG